jgi:type IV secretion system protein VirB2
MIVNQTSIIRRRIGSVERLRWKPSIAVLIAMLLLCPSVALAQIGGSPFESGFTALQTLFTGTIAKVASLIAIVVGGYMFAHGEPGAKKNLAGVAAGTGIAVLATNILSWLWGM